MLGKSIIQFLKSALSDRTPTKAAFIWYLYCSIAVLSQGCNTRSGKSKSVVQMNQQPQDCTRKVCEGSDVEFVTRAEWHAREPRQKSNITGPVNMTFIHHTAGIECFDEESCSAEVRSVQNFHMDDRKWDDIGYSFLIGEDGRVYEGRGWGVVGAHTQHYNAVAYGFSVMGNFMEKIPNNKALTAVKAIINCGVKQGYINENYEMFGHRDGRCTDCPGNQFYDLIKTWPHFSFRNITKYC